jgi:S1-C subfamily serine protease
MGDLLRPSTVRILAAFNVPALTEESGSQGTGIVYDAENGYIITNAHVVEGASSVQITLAKSERMRSARVVGRSQCDDLAVLKVENTQDLKAATLGTTVKSGAEVATIGYPQSEKLIDDISVNWGGVSQLNVQIGNYEDLIQINATINSGNSGGPLVNNKGEVVGINTASRTDAQNTNYAISMAYAEPIIKQLEQGKNRHFIGLNLEENQWPEYFGTEGGMAVMGVSSGSPGSQADIEAADLLVKLEGETVNTMEDVCRILRSHADGDQLKVTILRATTGEVLEGELTMGKIGPADDKTVKLEVVGTVDNGQAAEENTGEQAAGGDTGGEDTSEQSNEGPSLLVNNSFDGDDVGTWPTGEADGYSATVADGAYTLNLDVDNMYLPLHPNESATLGDGAIAVQVRPEGDGFAGVVARYAENGDARSMYVCWISNSGQFGCSKDVNNEWTVIVKPQASATIKPNEYNKVVLAAVGNEFSFEINDEEVATFTDDALTSGGWGVYAETTPGQFKAHYDHIAIASVE